ncbi:MAG: hypothetical protein ACE5KE_12740 [Methanosarcinales archaeon]
MIYANEPFEDLRSSRLEDRIIKNSQRLDYMLYKLDSEILRDWLDVFIESQNPSLWERINKEREAFHKEGGIDFEEYRTKRKLLNAKDHV